MIMKRLHIEIMSFPHRRESIIRRVGLWPTGIYISATILILMLTLPAKSKESLILKKSLPADFVAIEGTEYHKSGYPLEIRCLKDDAAMVFVPDGSFNSGLNKEQLSNLTKLILQLESRSENHESFIEDFIEDLNENFKNVKPGKMLTSEDLKNWNKLSDDQKFSILIISMMEKDDHFIDIKDLDNWRNNERSLQVLLTFPAVQKYLGFQSQIETEYMAEYMANLMRHMLIEVTVDPLQKKLKYLSGIMKPYAKQQLGSFYMDKYEVTNRQYRIFMKEMNHKDHHPGIEYRSPTYNLFGGKKKFYDLWKDRKRNHDNQPVTCVSAEDSIAYAKWAGKSIPTRLHWERAATGDGNQIFPWGSDFKSYYCRTQVKSDRNKTEIKDMEDEFKGKWGKVRLVIGASIEIYAIIRDGRNSTIPSKVGMYPHDRSPFGCYDMAGNVSEWVKWDKQDDYRLIGGNCSSVTIEKHIPARKEDVYVDNPRLYGFRTMLLLENN